MDEVAGLLPLLAVLVGVAVPRPVGTNIAFLIAAVSTFVLTIYYWNEGATDDGLFTWKPLLATVFGMVLMGVFRPQPWRSPRRAEPTAMPVAGPVADPRTQAAPYQQPPGRGGGWPDPGRRG